MFVATQKPTPPWKDVSCLRNTQKRHLDCEVWLTIFLYSETETRVEIDTPFRNCLQIELLFSVNFKGEVTLSTGLLWIRQVLNQSTPNPQTPGGLIELAVRKLASLGLQKLQVFQLLPGPSRMDSVGKTVWPKRVWSHGHIQHTEIVVLPNEKFGFGKRMIPIVFWFSKWHEKLWQAYGRFVHYVRRGSCHISRVTSSCLWLRNWNCTLWWLYQLWRKIATSTLQIGTMFFVFLLYHQVIDCQQTYDSQTGKSLLKIK